MGVQFWMTQEPEENLANCEYLGATTGCRFKTQICILKLTSGKTAEIPFWPGRGRRFRAKADIESQAGSASSVALSLACDRYFVGVVVLDR